MAKRRYDFDEKKISRYIKEGRGKGYGGDYKPWLQTYDVPSLGRVGRPYGFKTGREHHLLSDLEKGLFYLLNWCESVSDIREQFPLDREITRMLAEDMGVFHPRNNHTQTDLVMTTDFIVDIFIDGHLRTFALAVKPSRDLDDERTIIKLEIERRYWVREGVSWGLVTEKELPLQRIASLKWLHPMYSLEHLETPYQDYWTDRCNQFLCEFKRARQGTIRDFNQYLEKNCEFAVGEPLTVLRHLLANRVIHTDLDVEFSDRASIRALWFSDVSDSKHRRAV